MILNPISIATQGVYSTNRNLGLASKGYIDVDSGEVELLPAGGAGSWINQRQEEDDIITIIMAFLKINH